MKAIFTSLCLFLVVVGTAKAIEYGKCGSSKSAVTIRKLSIDPDPIVLSRDSLKISAAVEVHDDIANDTIVETKIWKVTWAFLGIKIYIRAPCVIGEGKCYMEFCKLLKSFNGECIQKRGIFSAEDVRIYLPDLSGTARWFASGYFHIEIRLFDKSSHAEKACYQVTGQAHP